jgi:hypothetical protein
MNQSKFFRLSLVSVVLFAIVFFSNHKAFGENWIANGTAKDGIEQLLDKDSITVVSPSVKRVMRKFIIPAKVMINLRKKYALSLTGYPAYSHSLSLWEINCNNKTIRILSYFDYDKKGTELDSHGYDNLEMIPIKPRSFDEQTFKAICP